MAGEKKLPPAERDKKIKHNKKNIPLYFNYNSWYLSFDYNDFFEACKNILSQYLCITEFTVGNVYTRHFSAGMIYKKLYIFSTKGRMQISSFKKSIQKGNSLIFDGDILIIRWVRKGTPCIMTARETVTPPPPPPPPTLQP